MALVLGIDDGARVEKSDGKITKLLIAWAEGDEAALANLMPLVVDELRRIARHHFERERRGHTWQPTELVNELYLHLLKRRRVNLKNRNHFFGFAAQAMRHILIDHVRIQQARKRGDGVEAHPLDEMIVIAPNQNLDLIAFHQALERLHQMDERQGRVVEMRLFAGLEHEEIAEVLGVTARTVKRDWRIARLWLHQQLDPEALSEVA